MDWLRPGRPLLLAHRGQSLTLPEQTMRAFRAAVDLGAQGIEADVHLTRDGEPVMLHDETLDRTTDGTGPVLARSLAEVRALDAGSWKGAQFRGEQVPTLEGLLDLADERDILLCLEAKGANHQETLDISRAIVERLQRRDRLDRHVLSSFDHAALAAARTWEPRLAIAPDRLPEHGHMDPATVVQQTQAIGAPIIQVHFAELDPPTVEALHTAGVAIWAWPTTFAPDIERSRDLGVDGLMGDDVPALVTSADDRESGQPTRS